MDHNKRTEMLMDDFSDLSQEALSAIHAALWDGYRHNYTDEWKGQSLNTHLDHAIMHLKGSSDDDCYTDLSHALCRVAMAIRRHFNEMVTGAWDNITKETIKIDQAYSSDLTDRRTDLGSDGGADVDGGVQPPDPTAFPIGASDNIADFDPPKPVFYCGPDFGATVAGLDVREVRQGDNQRDGSQLPAATCGIVIHEGTAFGGREVCTLPAGHGHYSQQATPDRYCVAPLGYLSGKDDAQLPIERRCGRLVEEGREFCNLLTDHSGPCAHFGVKRL